MKAEIDLSGVKGIENYTATGEFRRPLDKEFFVSAHGQIGYSIGEGDVMDPRIILKPAKVFPKGLLRRGDVRSVSRDKNGEWHAWSGLPHVVGDEWRCGGHICSVVTAYCPELQALDSLDWKETLIERPVA